MPCKRSGIKEVYLGEGAGVRPWRTGGGGQLGHVDKQTEP